MKSLYKILEDAKRLKVGIDIRQAIDWLYEYSLAYQMLSGEKLNKIATRKAKSIREVCEDLYWKYDLYYEVDFDPLKAHETAMIDYETRIKQRRQKDE